MYKRTAIIIVAVLLAVGVLGTSLKRVSSPVASTTQSGVGSQLSDTFSSFDGQLSPGGPLAVSLSAANTHQTSDVPPAIVLSLVALSLLTIVAIMYQRNTPHPIY